MWCVMISDGGSSHTFLSSPPDKAITFYVPVSSFETAQRTNITVSVFETVFTAAIDETLTLQGVFVFT